MFGKDTRETLRPGTITGSWPLPSLKAAPQRLCGQIIAGAVISFRSVVTSNSAAISTE